MKLFIDDILIENDFNRELIVGDCLRKDGTDSIVLTKNSIDSKWITNIKNNSINKDGLFVADRHNRFYILLYLIFSFKRRVHFADYLHLYIFDNDFTVLPVSKDVQEVLWDKLESFMRENSYSWRLIRDDGFVYRVRGRVPFSYYSKSEWFSFIGIKTLALSTIHSLQRKYIKCLSDIWKKTARRRISCELKKHYDTVDSVHIVSGSGNLFYKASDNKKSVFVKAGNRHFTDIEAEINAVKFLCDKTSRQELYLIPEIAPFSSCMLLSSFNKQVTLKDAQEMNMMGSNEIAELIDFCIDTVKDMKSIGFLHRDIQPANFLLKMDNSNKIVGFKLMDFGCAVIEHKTQDKSIRQLIINRYAGNKYRLSVDQWNDAASMFYMIIQLKAFTWDLFMDKMKLLFNEIE